MQAYPKPCGVKNAWGSYYNKQWWSYVQWWPYTVQITLSLLLLLNENQHHTSHEQMYCQSIVTVICPTRPHNSPLAYCCPLLCMHKHPGGHKVPQSRVFPVSPTQIWHTMTYKSHFYVLVGSLAAPHSKKGRVRLTGILIHGNRYA